MVSPQNDLQRVLRFFPHLSWFFKGLQHPKSRRWMMAMSPMSHVHRGVAPPVPVGTLLPFLSADCSKWACYLGMQNLNYHIWRFPKMVVPLNHPFLFGIFHETNHPAIGIPPFMETPIWRNTPETSYFRGPRVPRCGLTIYWTPWNWDVISKYLTKYVTFNNSTWDLFGRYHRQRIGCENLED